MLYQNAGLHPRGRRVRGQRHPRAVLPLLLKAHSLHELGELGRVAVLPVVLVQRYAQRAWLALLLSAVLKIVTTW